MSWIFPAGLTRRQQVEALLFSAGVQALVLFRISSWLQGQSWARRLRLPLFFYRLNQFLCKVDLDPAAQIGENLWLPHPFGVVVGSTAVIGNDVILMQNVTIGARILRSEGKRHATLSDGVFVGPNAVIMGDVTIGHAARVGAGSIVLADVSPGAVVTGVHK